MSKLIALLFVPLCFGQTDIQKTADRQTDFTIKLYKEIVKGTNDNVFISGYSIAAALAMLNVGTAGNTKTQLLSGMGFSGLQNMDANMKSLSDALFAPNQNYTLKQANRLFGRQGSTFLPAFTNTIKQYYGGEMQMLDFQNNPEAAKNVINQWVESQTNQKIKDLVSQVNKDTLLYLVNAIYFKASWTKGSEFDPKLTAEENFQIDENSHIKHPMMKKESGKYMYGENAALDAKVLELPYEYNKDLSFLAILPNSPTGVKKVEDKLTAAVIHNLFNSLRSEDTVKAWIPKFKLEDRTDLKPLLQAVGMTDMFDAAKADLSLITGQRNLVVSEAVHKAFIDVNEEGTEAAAATAIGISETSIREPKKVEFLAKHPFLFLIRHKVTGAVLFMGKLANPNTAAQVQSSGACALRAVLAVALAAVAARLCI